jgi:hypothetical protein
MPLRRPFLEDARKTFEETLATWQQVRTSWRIILEKSEEVADHAAAAKARRELELCDTQIASIQQHIIDTVKQIAQLADVAGEAKGA